MTIEATENTQDRITVEGQIVSTIRYADDKAVVASTQHLTDNLSKVTKKYGTKINVKQTKLTCVSRKGNHKINTLIEVQQMEQVT